MTGKQPETCHLCLPSAEITNVHHYTCISDKPLSSFTGLSLSGFPGTYLSRACKRNLVYANMRSYCCPCCWSIPWQNIDDARWKASLKNTNWRQCVWASPFRSAELCFTGSTRKRWGNPLRSVFPTSLMRAPMYSALSGVCSAGLITTVFPQHSAGAIFQVNISRGKFHWKGKARLAGVMFLHYFNFQTVTCQILKIVLNINPLHCQV